MRYLESRKYHNSSDKSKPPCILFWAGSELPIDVFYNSSGFVTDILAEKCFSFETTQYAHSLIWKQKASRHFFVI